VTSGLGLVYGLFVVIVMVSSLLTLLSYNFIIFI